MMWLMGLTRDKAMEYLASPLFQESQQQLADGDDVEDDLYDGLFWEMVLTEHFPFFREAPFPVRRHHP